MQRFWALTLAFFALVSLVLLAGALRDANFLPSRPISGVEGERISIDLTSLKDSLIEASDIPLWKQAIFFGVIFLFLSLIAFLLTPELRKKLFLMLLRLLAAVLMVYYLLKIKPDILTNLLQVGQLGQVAETMPEGAPPVFEPPQASPAISFFLTLAFVVLVVALIWGISRWWARQKELVSQRKPLTDIASIARASLRELSMSSNSDDAIIQCYVQMSNAVAVKRGLYRKNAMTPAEFVSYLENSGIPREPIARLTGLFENVRYGGYKSGPREIDEASDCLRTILRYCGETE